MSFKYIEKLKDAVKDFSSGVVTAVDEVVTKSTPPAKTEPIVKLKETEKQVSTPKGLRLPNLMQTNVDKTKKQIEKIIDYKKAGENFQSKINTPEKMQEYVRYQSERYGTKNDKPNEYYKWNLTSPDGKDFGEVSWDIMRHAYDGMLYAYVPKNEKEKEIITNFRKHKGYDLGEGLGAVSYDDYIKLSKGDLEGKFDAPDVVNKLKSDAVYPFQIDNGTDNPEDNPYFGKISYNAAKYFEKNGSFYGYDVVNADEAKAIADYTKWRKTEQNKAENPYSVMTPGELKAELLKNGKDYAEGKISDEDYFTKKDTINMWRIQKADAGEIDGIVSELGEEDLDFYYSIGSGLPNEQSSSIMKKVNAYASGRVKSVESQIAAAKARKEELINEAELERNASVTNSKYKKFVLDAGEKLIKTEETSYDYLAGNLYKSFETEEKKIYQALNRINPEYGSAYFREMEDMLKLRATREKQREAVKFGEEHPYLAGLKGIWLNLTFGIPNAVDNLGDLITEGKVDTYDASARLVRESQALRQGGSQYMQKKYGKGASWAYNTGFTVVENAIVIAATKGIGKAVGLGVKGISRLSSGAMAINAASNQMITIADRGGNDAQIIIGGIASGAAEWFFEKYSVENFIAPGSSNKFLSMLKQSGIEASEETLTEIANIYADVAIMGQKSENRIKAREYVLSGLSAEEAEKKVFMENLDQVLQAGMSGAASGVVMSGGQTAIEDITNAAARKGIEISIGKDASLPNIIHNIAKIEGRGVSYYDSKEAIETARAVLNMANGMATKADYALIERSNGARAIVLATYNKKGDGAWGKLREEAVRRMQNAEKIPSPPEAALSPLGKGRSEMRSDTKTPYATENNDIGSIKEIELYSNGKRVTFEKGEKISKNIVLDENSREFRKKNKEAYKATEILATDHKMKVKYVKGLTDAKGKSLDGIMTNEGIIINTEAENPTRFATTHEFGHRMKQIGGKAWENYQSYVINHLKNKITATGESLYKVKYDAKRNAYAENEIDEEIAVDYIGEMFDDVTELSTFIRKSRQQAFSVRNVYYAVLDKLGLSNEKQKAQRLWAKAYREAMRNKDEVQNAEYGVRSESKESKSGTRVDDSSENQYNNTEQYRTMWTIEENVLSRNEVKQFYSEIQNLANGSEKYEISSDGDYIFEIGNNLVYTDGNFEYPTISKVIEFDTEYEGDLEFAKELILNEERTQSEIADAIHLIEEMYGYGYVSERNFEDSSAHARQRRSGKRTNSSTTDRGTRKSVSGTRVTDSTAREERLMEENKRLREQIENMHIQIDQAEGKGLDLNAIKKAAEDIKRAYYSNIKTSELHQELTKVYRLMASNEASGDEIADRIKAIAEKVIDKATEKIEFTEYKSLLDDIRNTKIAVPEADKASFADGYDNFRKSNRGKIKLNDEGYSLDAFWDDLVSEYPNLFSDELRGSEERLERILEVREEFQTVEKAVFETDEQYKNAVTALSNDIMESFFKIPESGDNKFVFYDKRASQAEKELKQAKEKFENLLKKAQQRINKNTEMYEHEINRIETRHQAELDRRDKKHDAEIAKAEEKTEKLRDRYDREKVKKGIDRYFNYLFKMYSEPTDARHIPENLRRDVGNILERINFETKYTDKLKEKGEESILSIRLEGIADVFKRIQNEAWGVLSTEDSPTIDAALKQDLQDLISEIPVDESGNYKRIQDMTTEEMKAVYEMLIAVHHAVTKSNEAFSDKIKGTISENAVAVDNDMAATRSKRLGSGEKLDYEGNKIKKAFDKLDKFFNEDLLQTWDFFHKLGGKMEELYGAARKAYNDHIANLRSFKKVLEESTKNVKIKRMDNAETIELLGGIKIELTRGQMLSLAALYKRPQGKKHILEGGIVTGRKWIDENGHKRNGNVPIEINEHDMGIIIERINDEETAMMEKIVEFMSKECSEWGNKTSMKLLGYEKYGESWYFPIKVWDGSLEKTSAKKGETKLTKKGFTKALDKNAGNAVEINDFLNVVLEHVNSMSMYSTVALPLLDMERVLNHRGESTSSRDAREAIRITYGKNAEQYIYDWIRTVNGATQKVKTDFFDKFISNTKKAHIAFKISVFLKQTTSIVRAWQVMNPIYLRSSINSYIHPKKTIREMQDNVPIAFWKSLGFRDPAMGTGIKEAMLGTESVTDKLGFGAYGLADDFTWGIIYNSVKSEVKSKMKSEIKSKMKNSTKTEVEAEIKKLNIKNKEFRERVIERFDYIIDRTQVVDSPFHNSQIMRSNNPLTKITTSYMSEPIKTLNLYRTDLQDALNESIKKGKFIPFTNKLTRSTATFLLTSALLAVAGAVPKLFKDFPEDKYDKDGKKISAKDRFLKYAIESFSDETNILKMIPYLNKIIDILEGWEQKDMVFENIEDVIGNFKKLLGKDMDYSSVPAAINSFKKLYKENKYGWYSLLRDSASSVAALFGQPYGNAVKEVEGIARTVISIQGKEYADYFITKSKWSVKNPKNQSKFTAFYDRALINGHPEEAVEIFSDYYGIENTEALTMWTEETARLYKATGDDSHFYNPPEDKFKFNGKDIELNEEQYKEYRDDVNKGYMELVDNFIKSDYYKKLSDKEKANELSKLRQWVTNKEKMKHYPVDLFDNKHSEKILDEMDELYIETGKSALGDLYDSSFKVDGKEIELEGNEYNEFLDKSYDVLWNMAYEMVKSEEYKNLNPKEKLSAFSDLKSYAKETQYFEYGDHEMEGWKGKVYSGEEAFIDNKIERLNEGYFEDNAEAWRDDNFNIDESKYSEAEVKSMEDFEKSASKFYVAHEMGRPYKEEDYRAVQTYHDYLSGIMTLEEFAGIRAYAKKTAAGAGKGSVESLSTKELKAYLDTLEYDRATKGALFEAIGNKNWKNPYSGGKVGDGTRFPVLTHSPVEGEKSDVKAPLSKEKIENLTPQTALPGGYTGDGSVKSTGKKINRITITPVNQTKNDVTVNYNPSKYNAKETEIIKTVQDDARSYYNAPRLNSYKNNALRHMYVFETKLASRISLDDYAGIRARAMNYKDNFTIEGLKEFIDGLSYDEAIKSALFEAIGEEDWENPYNEEKSE